jgi:hypothetical protein
MFPSAMEPSAKNLVRAFVRACVHVCACVCACVSVLVCACVCACAWCVCVCVCVYVRADADPSSGCGHKTLAMCGLLSGHMVDSMVLAMVLAMVTLCSCRCTLSHSASHSHGCVIVIATQATNHRPPIPSARCAALSVWLPPPTPALRPATTAGAQSFPLPLRSVAGGA